MKWSSCYPTVPGYYLVVEDGIEPVLLKVDVESDSHNMFFATIPGEGHKYPLDLWQGALWYGPVSGLH